MSSYSENINCPKCGGIGILEHTEDDEGTYEQCIECGYCTETHTVISQMSIEEVNAARDAVELPPLTELKSAKYHERGLDMDRDDLYYCNWNDFRKWAECQGWYLLIYDTEHPSFITPTGNVIELDVDNDDYVVGVQTVAGKWA